MTTKTIGTQSYGKFSLSNHLEITKQEIQIIKEMVDQTRGLREKNSSEGLQKNNAIKRKYEEAQIHIISPRGISNEKNLRI